ncbi:cytochrome P450 [Pseudonocardia sp. ICBG1142]|uniref:cytochrome P450 n=1 Tax=Pseudonocardia sp. ICBG1142 TaxID=2846760 RepID=UPI001CF64415|nr:cytochrome P450 [Pseudonocardia sp. ICBG1142]
MGEWNSIPRASGALPVVGHLLSLARDPHGFMRSLAEYGHLVQIRIGPTAAIVVCDPDLTRHVLRNDRVFDKGGPLNTRIEEALGAGLVTSSYDQHRRQRRLVQHAFHTSRLSGYERVMTAEIARVVNSWRSGQVIDVITEMTAITSRVLATIMFTDAISNPELKQALDDLATLLPGLYRRTLTPRILERLPLPGDHRYRNASARLRHIITKAVVVRRTSNTAHEDLLSALLAARGTGEKTSTDVCMTDDEIASQAMEFFVAGTETTASALTWALHLLAAHPHIERQLHTEVDTAYTKFFTDPVDLLSLPLIRRVITETLRLYPPAWILTRTVTSPAHLGGYPLAPGTSLIYCPYLLHRHSDFYPDPDHFDPDRWTPERATTIPSAAFIPFGSGPRKCIGDTFAMTETTLALATITRHWTLSPIPSSPIRPALTASLRPRQLRMRVRPRIAPPASEGTVRTSV